MAVFPTPYGLRLEADNGILTLFIWKHLNTTYFKVFQWSEQPLPEQTRLLATLTQAIRQAFPHHPQPFPEIDLAQQDIFTALAPHYPLTAKYFQRMPNGEFDCNVLIGGKNDGDRKFRLVLSWTQLHRC